MNDFEGNLDNTSKIFSGSGFGLINFEVEVVRFGFKVCKEFPRSSDITDIFVSIIQINKDIGNFFFLDEELKQLIKRKLTVLRSNGNCALPARFSKNSDNLFLD